jgi:hypothetical protein
MQPDATGCTLLLRLRLLLFPRSDGFFVVDDDLLLLLQEPLCICPVQGKCLIVTDAHGVEQEVTVFAGESGFEFLVCVQGDGAWAFLYGNLALDLDGFDLQGSRHDVSDGAARAI